MNITGGVRFELQDVPPPFSEAKSDLQNTAEVAVIKLKVGMITQNT